MRELIVDLYNSIYTTLSNDPEILSYLQLSSSSDNLSVAKKISKQSRPPNIVENMPLMTFYNIPSKRSRQNYIVFNYIFNFDIYTANDPNTAHLISQRIFQLFETNFLVTSEDTETMESLFVDSYEFPTGFQNVYGYRNTFQFPASIENC